MSPEGETDAPLLDRAPERPDAAPAEPAQASESVFTDEVGGKPISLEDRPDPLPAAAAPGALGAAPGKRPSTWKRLATALRIRRADPAPATAVEEKGAPCPACGKPLAKDCTACAFCGKALVRILPSLEHAVPGAGGALAFTPEHAKGGYVPEQLAGELEAERQKLLERDTAWKKIRAGNRRRVLRFAPVAMAFPYIFGWWLGGLSGLALAFTVAIELLYAWACVHFMLARGGGVHQGLLLGAPKVFASLCIAYAVLQKGSIAVLIISVSALALSGAVGVLVEIEFLELRKG